ncbi:MAG: hypothetical protein J6X62_04135 [Bacteroidales bacterium]|nr:hypothetical protein [Bacteroidales bacterium]
MKVRSRFCLKSVEKKLLVAAVLSLFFAVAPTRGQVSLSLSRGAGYAMQRDLGVSPISYQGLAGRMGLGVDVRLPRWSIEIDRGTLAALYESGTFGEDGNSMGYGISSCQEVCALRQMWTHGRWLLMAGPMLSSNLALKLNPELFNASFGLSGFASLSLKGRICFDFGREDEDYRHYRFRFYGQQTLSPMTLAVRPGYSYIDNYSGTTDQLSAFLETYELMALAAAEWHSELGVKMQMPSGNRIGLAYRWDYCTTYNAGAWRFDEAFHMAVASFDFILK